MSQTVIGIFENSTEAQDAKAYLLSNGFSSQNVDINTNGASSSGGTTEASGQEGIGDRVGNFFKNLFTDEGDAASYTAAGQKGTIVTVHAKTSDEATAAAEILNNHGAIDVNDYNGTSGTKDGVQDKIKVVKEELQVGKREVETGGVRLRSRIVERPVEESIRLREEHVNIERTAVDRPATEADFTNFKEGTVDLTEHAEIPVVAKTARVVEEVSLGKEVSEKEETISDTVRHTEVDIEQIPVTEKRYSNSKENDTL